MEQLLHKDVPGASKDNCQLIAVEGLGGIGKTQIAIEAAFQVRNKHPGCSVFWVPALDGNSFENAYLRIGQELKVSGIEEDKADVKKLVMAALNRENIGSWLLVVDNADDTDLFFGDTALANYLPSSQNGIILFTTRNHEIVRRLGIRQANRITVNAMSRSEAIDLLRIHLRPEQTSDAESTTDLLDFLADLPLAIKQASACMDQLGITATRYLELCRSSEVRPDQPANQGFRRCRPVQKHSKSSGYNMVGFISPYISGQLSLRKIHEIACHFSPRKISREISSLRAIVNSRWTRRSGC